MNRNMRAAAARPANMRRLGGAHPTATVSAATVAAAAVSAAAAGICFECEKRHDEEQHRSNASAGRQNRPHGPAGLGARRRRLSLGILPKSF